MGLGFLHRARRCITTGMVLRGGNIGKTYPLVEPVGLGFLHRAGRYVTMGVIFGGGFTGNLYPLAGTTRVVYPGTPKCFCLRKTPFINSLFVMHHL